MVTAHHVAESLRHLMHKVFKKAAIFGINVAIQV